MIQQIKLAEGTFGEAIDFAQERGWTITKTEDNPDLRFRVMDRQGQRLVIDRYNMFAPNIIVETDVEEMLLAFTLRFGTVARKRH